MFKMFLRAAVPNEGARRLAWFIGTRGAAGVATLSRHGIGEALIERLIAGDMEPGEAMGWAISRATGGTVRIAAWRDPAQGRWGERPFGDFGPVPTMFSPNRTLTIDDPARGGSAPGAWRRAMRQMRLPRHAAQAMIG